MTGSTTLGCSHTFWIGDGYCDDTTNIMECSFDGGDCCGSNVNTAYCNLCQCLTGDTTLQSSTTTSSSETSTLPLTTPHGTTVAGKVLTWYFSNSQFLVGGLLGEASSLNIC